MTSQYRYYNYFLHSPLLLLDMQPAGEGDLHKSEKSFAQKPRLKKIVQTSYQFAQPTTFLLFVKLSGALHFPNLMTFPHKTWTFPQYLIFEFPKNIIKPHCQGFTYLSLLVAGWRYNLEFQYIRLYLYINPIYKPMNRMHKMFIFV